jgi:uncharacterized membrane protein
MNDASVGKELEREGVLDQPQLLFTMWAIATGFCASKADFRHHFADHLDIEGIMATLERLDLSEEDGERLELTPTGRELVGDVNDLSAAESPVQEAPAMSASAAGYGVQDSLRQSDQIVVVALVVDSARDADHLAERILRFVRKTWINVRDAAIIARTEDGGVTLTQEFAVIGPGAFGSAFWNELVRQLIASPRGELTMEAGSTTDVGIDTNFVRSVSKAITQGGAALFLIASHRDVDKALSEIVDVDLTVIQTVLTSEQERHLRAALGQYSGIAGTARSAATDAVVGGGAWTDHDPDADEAPPTEAQGWRRYDR